MSVIGVPKPSKSKSGPKRPTRDEFELEEIGEKLAEAKEDGRTRSLTVWGAGEQVHGKVVKLDAQTRTIHIQELYGTIQKVPFLDIMKVESQS